MKQFLLVAALCVAGFTSAKVSVYSTVLTTDMTYEQYSEFMLKVVETNNQVCENHNPGPSTFYAKNDINFRNAQNSPLIN